MLTNERLKEIVEEYTDAIEVGQMARELLTIREAGDETGTEVAWYTSPHEEAERLWEQLREARAEIERLAAERDEALGKNHSAKIFIDALSKWLECGATLENSSDWHSYLQTVANNWNLRMQEACDLRDSLKAELAAIKSAPGMADVDALRLEVFEWLRVIQRNASPNSASDFRDLQNAIGKFDATLRRSIAAREEAVGLLKYLFRNQDLQSDRAIMSDEARRILEIVEGESC